jgi:hypothetical protein
MLHHHRHQARVLVQGQVPGQAVHGEAAHSGGPAPPVVQQSQGALRVRHQQVAPAQIATDSKSSRPTHAGIMVLSHRHLHVCREWMGAGLPARARLLGPLLGCEMCSKAGEHHLRSCLALPDSPSEVCQSGTACVTPFSANVSSCIRPLPGAKRSSDTLSPMASAGACSSRTPRDILTIFL